jgi:hypothetical protein
MEQFIAIKQQSEAFLALMGAGLIVAIVIVFVRERIKSHGN